MRKYWLLDQHGEDGPTALVMTDGSMHITRILQFGPGITELDDQQEILDRVVGKLAPTMKPLVDGGSIDVDGVEPHADLRDDSTNAAGQTNRAGRRNAGRSSGPGGRMGGGPSRTGGRGDR